MPDLRQANPPQARPRLLLQGLRHGSPAREHEPKAEGEDAMTDRIRIPLREILSPSKASELAESIAAAKRSGEATYAGVWCARTGTAVIAEIAAGSLTRWHARGPLTLPEARAFLGVAEATLAAPPTASAH